MYLLAVSIDALEDDMRGGRFPNSFENTHSNKKYIDAWREFARPITELTGMKHWAFDPGVSYRNDSKTINLPEWFIALVNEALANAP